MAYVPTLFGISSPTTKSASNLTSGSLLICRQQDVWSLKRDINTNSSTVLWPTWGTNKILYFVQVPHKLKTMAG